MKKILSLLVCIVIVFTFVACNMESKIELQESNGIVLLEEYVSPMSGAFCLKNNSDQELSTGRSYIIEEYRNNKWVEIYQPNDMPAESIEISANSDCIFVEDWSVGLRSLHPGKYRFIKTNIYSPESGHHYNIACEFEIT